MRLQPRLIAAYRLLQGGCTEKARAACRRILRETPEDAVATHLLGLVHQADGDLMAAERFMRLSIRLDPAVAEYRANLGDLLRDTGRTGDAERAFREALALDPSSQPARAGLARLLEGRP